MSESKVTERLARTLEDSSEEELVELVIELAKAEPPSEPTLSRAEKIGAMKKAFETVAEPLERGIEAAGGETVGRAWLNQTVKARVPRSAVSTLSSLESVSRVDLTDRIEPEPVEPVSIESEECEPDPVETDRAEPYG